jgi:hypothetical protein
MATAPRSALGRGFPHSISSGVRLLVPTYCLGDREATPLPIGRRVLFNSANKAAAEPAGGRETGVYAGAFLRGSFSCPSPPCEPCSRKMKRCLRLSTFRWPTQPCRILPGLLFEERTSQFRRSHSSGCSWVSRPPQESGRESSSSCEACGRAGEDP